MLPYYFREDKLISYIDDSLRELMLPYSFREENAHILYRRFPEGIDVAIFLQGRETYMLYRSFPKGLDVAILGSIFVITFCERQSDQSNIPSGKINLHVMYKFP